MTDEAKNPETEANFGDVKVLNWQGDVHALSQIIRCREAVDGGAALMPDHHVGYGCPIGGVVWDTQKISPQVVGYDIGCGNKAVRLDVDFQSLSASLPSIMDEIWTSISFGIGRNRTWDVDHEVLDDPRWKLLEDRARLLDDSNLTGIRQIARNQLGTVGAGNHFVDLLVDENGAVWVAVHFGSRGPGHKIATHFLREAGATGGFDAQVVWLDASTGEGSDYVTAMRLAGEFARAGRDLVCEKVASIISAKAVEEVHNHHNFAWRETIGDVEFWVGRKGATPAYPGQRGFVGGTMATHSYIVSGTDHPEARETFYSTVHGAGRAMSRSDAVGIFDRKTGEVKKPARVNEAEWMQEMSDKGVELRGGRLDEAPKCYKPIESVIERAVEAGVEIVRILRPVGVAMAGKFEHDPYKD